MPPRGFTQGSSNTNTSYSYPPGAATSQKNRWGCRICFCWGNDLGWIHGGTCSTTERFFCWRSYSEGKRQPCCSLALSSHIVPCVCHQVSQAAAHGALHAPADPLAGQHEHHQEHELPLSSTSRTVPAQQVSNGHPIGESCGRDARATRPHVCVWRSYSMSKRTRGRVALYSC